jgi:hypothetical protein
MRAVVLLVGLGAALAGAVLATIVGSTGSHPNTPAALPSSAVSVGQPPEGTPGLAALELRLQALEARERLRGADAQTIAPSAGPTPFLSPEDEAEAAKKGHERWVSRFDAESVDPHWSESAQADFNQDLDRLASTGGFSVQSVNCRVTMCKAELQWPSYAAARRSDGYLMTYRYTENCARHFFHPPPDDPSAPYSATVYYDCESSRSQ